MGIIYRQARMLLDAHRAGVAMHRFLMIGRQSLLLHPSELRAIRAVFPGALADYQWGEYSERFFKECLGASEVNTLDYSPYEGADLLYDLNHPVPPELKGRFDVVVEAGSLEHIFNFPIAVANLMYMTKVGGKIFASTVSNNLCGHGFYQFSPELVFRVFSAENGFEIGKVLALEARYPGIELAPISEAFEVADPAFVRARVGLMTKRPIMLFFDARKTADLPLFTRAPMQSDYASAWASDATGKGTLQKPKKSRMSKWIKSLPPYTRLRTWLTGRRQISEFSLKNRRHFKKT
jgi:hypothetical protein